jgi:iron complex transport system permease protein
MSTRAVRIGRKKLNVSLIILIVLPLALFFISLFLGRYPISPWTALQVLVAKIIPIAHTWPDTVETVIFEVRLPRALIAMAVGAGLSISGASYQGMFRNPLVSPDILGVSAAAGFGAAVAILISGNSATIQILAFLSGVAGVVLTYLISRVYKTTPVLMLVLSGVVVGSLFSALISVTKYVADPDSKLPAITFWLMGSLSTTSMKDLVTTIPPILVGSAGLMAVSWRINILAMGDDEARSLGVKTELLKAVIIICTTVVTAAAVCVAGIIGWVGLVIPHIARMLVGPDHKVLLPATLSIGAAYMLFIDDLARTLTAAEIPLGILTAIIGAPFFAYLLRRTKGGWK